MRWKRRGNMNVKCSCPTGLFWTTEEDHGTIKTDDLSATFGPKVQRASHDPCCRHRQSHRLLRQRRLQGRPRAPRRDPDREPESRAAGRACALSSTAEMVPALDRARFLLPDADAGQGARAVPLRRAHRGRRACRPCSATATATSSAGSTPAGSQAFRRGHLTETRGPLLRPRRRRQQGPAHDQPRGAWPPFSSARGQLGFNAKWLIEMGEETGSPGLRELCAENRELFAADVLIASDGPRLSADRPTIFLGSRGAYPIDIWIDAREGGHHSGNWGGLLSNPAIQLVPCALRPSRADRTDQNPAMGARTNIPNSVRHALADCEVRVRPGRSRRSIRLGRARPDARRKGLRLVHVRDPRR